MSKLRADIWVSAFVRRHNNVGNFCVVSRRGDVDAGQIWIEVDHLNGKVSLFSPAPTNPDVSDREFMRRIEAGTPTDVRERIEKEADFDPDFWVISIETRDDELGLAISDLS
ncbi:DUF1491 family protein [Maritalea sp.]|uniref:DUF1491 family protein n=1 Tax=Maritalea sp. TaxID=2003361 RepID=UPI003EF28D8A